MAVVIHGTRTNNTDIITPDFPGAVIQIVQGNKTDTFSTSANLATKATVTGLSASITPTSATNKILVQLHMHIGGSINTHVAGLILRDSTEIGIADANGSRTRNSFAVGIRADYNGSAGSADWTTAMVSQCVLDSPATTSATTYKLQAQCLSTNGIIVNMTRYDTDNGNASRGSSTITVMEIAQ